MGDIAYDSKRRMRLRVKMMVMVMVTVPGVHYGRDAWGGGRRRGGAGRLPWSGW